MGVVWIALLAGGELWVGLRGTILLLLWLLLLLLLLLVMVLWLCLGREGILAARILLLRRVQPHRSRGHRRVRVPRFMLLRRLRPLLIEGLWRRWLLGMLVLLRRQWSSIRARRRPLLEQRRREAASLTALVLTRRATRPGVVVEHVAQVHNGCASCSKNALDVSCVLLAGASGLCAGGATTRTRWKI